jgi:hypothetical protein
MTRQRFAALPNRSTPVSRMRVMRLTQLRMLGRDACQASQRFVTTFSMRARPPGRRSAYLPAPPNVCRRPRPVTVEASTWPCGSEPSTRVPSLPDLRLACKFSVFLIRRVRTKPPSCVRSAGLAAQECRNIENAFIDKISRRRWPAIRIEAMRSRMARKFRIRVCRPSVGVASRCEGRRTL